MPYAAKTDIDPIKTRADIERLLQKHGADRFMYFTEPGKAVIVFEMSAEDTGMRRLKFSLPLPDVKDRGAEQKIRGRWRALLLCVKAKLEAVAIGVETFEDAFMAHVVMPDGKTVGEHIRPRIALAYQNESMVPLLPGPTDQR